MIRLRCVVCQAEAEARRVDARFCSVRCRNVSKKRAWRARVVSGETVPAPRPVEPAPEPSWGRWGTRGAAREGLRVRMVQDGGWWGEVMVRRWAELHGLGLDAALELLAELSLEGQVYARAREPAQWRAA